jgi:transposase
MRYIGIDVDSAKLVVQCGGESKVEVFANDAGGHRRLQRWVGRQAPARVCLEASGTYSLDVAHALHAVAGVEVMVVNPRASKHFAEALLTRSRDDESDACRLAQFAARMPFVAWSPPSPAALALRQIGREGAAVSDDLTAVKNRYHAAKATRTTPAVLLAIMERNIGQIEERIEELERAAMELVAGEAPLSADYELIATITGFGRRSSLRVLGELACRSGPLEPRQLVAFAGIDVITHKSGTSVDHTPHISKRGNAHLRRAVYMPALVAIRCEEHVRAFHDRLIARGLQPLQAIVAVMRKLLHAISAVLRHRSAYDPTKLFARPLPACLANQAA